MNAEPDMTDKSEEVNKLFERTTDTAVPGASIIIIQDGNVLFKRGYGFADVENNTPNTSRTIFRLGSITKQFTAMAILQLHDKQRLQIDDPVEKYLPGIENRNDITIRHLLTHTSGIIETPDSKLEFLPGDQFSYSNTGYNLLGEIIEHVSGSPYHHYLAGNVFIPLNMNDTGYEHQGTKIKKMAVGYQIGEDGRHQNIGETDASGAYAAGALYSTVEDMYLWDQALYPGVLVPASLLDQAFAQATLNDGSKVRYGFGWMVNQWRGLKELSHGGDIAGFNTFIARFPAENFTTIVLSNVEMRPPGPLPSAEELVYLISDIYLSDKLTVEDGRLAIKLDPDILKKYVGQYELTDAPESVIQAGGAVYTIVQRDNQLFVQSKLGEQEIYAETETKFYLDNNSIINFKKEKDRITGMVIDLMGLGISIVNANKFE